MEEPRVGYRDAEKTAPLRYLATYWVDHCPYDRERIARFLKDLRTENHLWK
jgi:hypothetical protein